MITVLDLFSTPLFSEFNLISGKKGLYNQVTGTAILEHESFEDIDRTFEKGEFAMTTLSQARNDPAYAEQQVRYLIDYGVSAIAIKTVFYRDISDSLKEYSDEKGIPIFFFEKVYIDDIIFTIKTLLASSQVAALQNDRIHKLISGVADPDDTIRIAAQINPFFYDNIYCIYFTEVDLKKIDISKAFKIPSSDHISTDSIIHSLLEFDHGAMLICSFESRPESFETLLEFLHLLCPSVESFRVGISNLHDSKKTLGKACQESMYANVGASISTKQIVRFSDLGVEQILLPHLKDEWSLNYYNNYLNRILDHDAKSGLDFLNTLLEYIKAFGNIREASEAVFQHPNTVRYRIGKIKDLWGIEENAEFYYEACIFCKLHLLYKLAPFSGMI